MNQSLIYLFYVMLRLVINDEKIHQMVVQKIRLMLKNICLDYGHDDMKMNDDQDYEMIDVMMNVHDYYHDYYHERKTEIVHYYYHRRHDLIKHKSNETDRQ
jgi:hypothetical protein